MDFNYRIMMMRGIFFIVFRGLLPMLYGNLLQIARNFFCNMSLIRVLILLEIVYFDRAKFAIMRCFNLS